jgi:hypothetical protein
MDKATTTADNLELLHLNQIVPRAATEEVSTWIRQRDSINAHGQVMVARTTPDSNTDAIISAIELLRL